MGFGNFVSRDKRSRMGRNPQTGDSMEISPRRVMTFKVSQILKEAINSGVMPTPAAVAVTKIDLLIFNK